MGVAALHGADTSGVSITVTPTFTAAPTVTALADPAVAANITSTLTAYNTFVEATIDNRATNAGNIASLQNTLQVLNSVAANEMAGIGQAQDTDIAKEMMNLTSANIMTDAATAMLAQAMQLPNAVLRLIQ